MRKDQIHLVAQLDNLCIDQWLFMMIIGTEGALGLPTAYDNQGWTGKLFFSRGGAQNLRGGAGQGTPPSPQCGAGTPPLPAGQDVHPWYLKF